MKQDFLSDYYFAQTLKQQNRQKCFHYNPGTINCEPEGEDTTYIRLYDGGR
jgi:hypothetical protein